MRMFHVSDILTVTTGRLVSSRHVEGVYDILDFLTGDQLFTHQLGRAMKECEPWLRSQFPYLMPEHPPIAKALAALPKLLALDGDDQDAKKHTIEDWVYAIRHDVKFPETIPEMLPVYEMGADMHTHIDPVEELEAMVGKDKIIVLPTPKL
jgi:hypothetical protein